MADNPFHPDYGAPGEAPPAQAPPMQASVSQPGLAEQWSEFLGDPASRAALISFGAQLAQPMALGQNALGHIGQAIGKGGEAATKAAAIDEKTIENISKQELRAAQADSATSRAGTAEANANTANLRMQAYQDRVGAQNELSRARSESEVYKRAKLEAEEKFILEKLRLYPESQLWKEQLMAVQIDKTQSQTGLNDARAAAIPTDVATRQQRANTQAKTAQDDLTLRAQTEERRAGGQAARSEQDYVKEYERVAKSIRDNNTRESANLLKSKDWKPAEIPSYQDWRKGYSEGARPPTGGGGAQLPPAPRDPAQRAANTTYMGENGKPYLWDGTTWIRQ